ncbi:MAG: precorrin-2 C(20)-methyltransferase [Bacilli bacterium]
MKGKLFGIGVGAGEADLLTIRAVNTIKKCDVIAVVANGESKYAFNIVKEYLTNKVVQECEFSMSPNLDTRMESRKKVFKQIRKLLDNGNDVGFLTIGDPTIYSTYMYVHKMINDVGYETEIISGIPSFIAAAGKLNISLCEGEEQLHIIPASKMSSEQIKTMMELSGNKVIMKSARNLGNVVENLKASEDNIYVVKNCCLEGEEIYQNLGTIEDLEKLGYLTIVLVKE